MEFNIRDIRSGKGVKPSPVSDYQRRLQAYQIRVLEMQGEISRARIWRNRFTVLAVIGWVMLLWKIL